MNSKNRISSIWWILCFIPVIGCFVGTIMIIYGLIKNKKYIIPGFIGVCFTAVCAFFFSFYMKYSKNVAKGFASISQNQINSICNSIELYKIKYGRYPDSLESLYIMDRTIVINDPILLGTSNEETKFHYEKKGDYYILFSVGVDNLPNTEDDIYPEVSDTSNLKYGFKIGI